MDIKNNHKKNMDMKSKIILFFIILILIISSIYLSIKYYNKRELSKQYQQNQMLYFHPHPNITLLPQLTKEIDKYRNWLIDSLKIPSKEIRDITIYGLSSENELSDRIMISMYQPIKQDSVIGFLRNIDDNGMMYNIYLMDTIPMVYFNSKLNLKFKDYLIDTNSEYRYIHTRFKKYEIKKDSIREFKEE